ncbi:hypothetical protein NUW54_g7227 [Trametes sanguinea]|uniref:Uncharacterized protein n=1 Tax=Trametes sanguinea TaxID=158606 RepID=A0ACC1PMG7_9APHY|nr:hypothetical protein NUW54_g7227 [Trametes sanguinea]
MRTAGRKSERTATSGKALKSKISDLAPALREPFNRRFVPLVRQFLGTRKPWQDATLVELQQLHRKAFGQELSDQYPLEERDHCFKLIHYRMDDWHSKFGSTAIATFEEIIKALRSGDDVASDGFTSQLEEEHDNPFSSPQGIGMYANWLLGDARKAAPFYWKRWNSSQDREVRAASSFRVPSLRQNCTFAYHLAEILALDPEERIMEYPVGALTLATLGAQHALSHYRSGVWNPPEGRAGFFSEDNYGDTVVFKDGQEVEDNRLSRILQVARNLSDEEWTKIYTAAYAVVERRKVTKGRRGKKDGRAEGADGAGAEGEVKTGADDDELMLME